MKVICAGLPKTGTKSLVTGLRQLGYTVYDSPESSLFHKEEWKTILDGDGSSELFQKMYENVDAVADTPACAMWDHIFEAFPDAKVSFYSFPLLACIKLICIVYKRKSHQHPAWKIEIS